MARLGIKKEKKLNKRFLYEPQTDTHLEAFKGRPEYNWAIILTDEQLEKLIEANIFDEIIECKTRCSK